MFDQNHPILGSQHADVLSAEPETEEAKVSLVEEIKNRARGIFASGNYPIAEVLYDKAIKVLPDAVLYANRSAARLNLNMVDAALEDADKAIALDGDYSKAYYRKGQAHTKRGEHTAAVAAFEKGLQLDPTNKTFAEMAAKAKAAAAKAAAEATATSPSTSTLPSSSPAAAPAPPRKPKASSGGGGGRKKKTGAGDSDEEEEAAPKAEELRGYKVLADGRKTTYFNNELSEETKKLIGDIAPKKIEAPAEATAAANRGGAGGGQPTGSAWNYAGTFEERNMTEWAKEKLQELLTGVSFVIPNVGSVLEVVKVAGLEGDAAVTFVRGKKKYLFDFVFTLEWEAELDCGKAKGSLKYPDVTPDNDDEYDTLLEVDPLTPPEARHLINRYVKADGEGLQAAVKEKLRAFMAEFQQF